MSAGRLVYLPDERQELLLRAALFDGDEAIDAWERWQSAPGGLESHDPASFRLLPLLYRNLAALGVDDAAMGKLSGVYRHSWYCNQRLFHEAAGVIRDLEEAGVETIALKGAALTALYYRDRGTRPMDDLDLLVRFHDAERALRVLLGGGWTLKSSQPPEQLLAARHAVGCRDRTGRELDLHWRALHVPGSDDSFWARAVPIAVGGAPTRALCPEHQLIHVCVHGIGLFPAPVRWVADALTVLKASGEGMDWTEVVEEARSRRASVALGEALRYVAQTFGAPVPDEALIALTRSKVSVGERLTHRAAAGSPSRWRFYVTEWYRYRLMRKADPAIAPRSFLVHLQYIWGLSSRWHVAARLARKALQVARYGRSHPSGDRMLAG